MDHRIRDSIRDMPDEELEKWCHSFASGSQEYKLAVEERASRQNKHIQNALQNNEILLKRLNEKPHPVLIWTLVFTGLCFLASAIAALSSIPVLQGWLSGSK